MNIDPVIISLYETINNPNNFGVFKLWKFYSLQNALDNYYKSNDKNFFDIGYIRNNLQNIILTYNFNEEQYKCRYQYKYDNKVYKEQYFVSFYDWYNSVI